MDNDSIVTDVSGANEAVSTRYDDSFEALVARREQEVSIPVGEQKIEVLDEDPKIEKPMLELVDDDGNVIRIPASAKYKAKIDGEETFVPVEQITRSYQKGAAADRRLEQATSALKEVEAKERELTEREKQFLAKQETLVQKRDDGKITDETYLEKAKLLLSALTDEYEDDPEGKIAAVLKEVSGRTQIDPDRLASEIEEKTYLKLQERENYQRQQLIEVDRVKANKRFDDEYSDVVQDPIAYRAAKNLAAEKWKEKPGAAPWEIASEVGNEIREWKRQVSLSQQTRNKTVTPKTVSARATIGQDEKTETRADVLAEMKMSRGQSI